MTGLASEVAAGQEMQREIGTWDSGRPGPTLLITGGIHGNEPSGVLAAERVLDVLRARRPQISGRVVALRGNLAALARGCRFLARDLNRGWSAASIAAVRALPEAERSAEDREQLEMIERFAEVERTATGPVLFVDLHTSSAAGSPFLCLADTIDNRRIGMSTGVPIILGIEENIAGASLEWFADRGIAGLTVEGGRHGSDEAVQNHEAVLWGLLVRLGMLPDGFVDLGPHRQRLRTAVGDAPPIVEIVHRHAITPEHGFRMLPGFVNFARVPKGMVLATDRDGEIRAPAACHLMLPLYQELGDDGFFLARRVPRFWLWVAKWLRALRLGGLLPLMPGISRAPDDRDTLLADPRIARWFVVEVFHLLGFRKRERRGAMLAFSRRRSRRENRRL
ncbi:MAG: succinylglutamate desuccinylase/aspartoacylase family protein [Planctomycetes bacterium]|nr:succinylglutamate desuccinylase/aspartoacylase family protein [Planctomycetota bacterium]